MKDFRTVTLADQVFERLESDIIQGVYPRGEVLTELRLVEQLNVSRTPIREALRRLEQEHLIADTGKGIPEAELDKIFEPFFTTKAVGKGTGLGLSISYSIIEKLGGAMRVQSKVGEGTVFTITLPKN